MNRVVHFRLASLALAAVGCSSSPFAADGQAAPDLAAMESLDFALASAVDLAPPPPPDLAPLPYPPGPYGNAVGATLPPLLWEGFVDEAADAVATTRPYVAYSMLNLHRSGRAYGLVHVAEFY